MKASEVAYRAADSHGDWVLYRRTDGGGPPIYVPPELASELTNEDRRREVEREVLAAQELEDRRQAGEQEQRTAKRLDTASLLAELVGQHEPHPLEVSRHQVLVDVDRVVNRVRQLRDGLGGDKDHARREELALTRALARGPYRSIVMPLEWRSALNDLATEMPAFRSAVDIVSAAYAVADATDSMLPSVPPILLLGPPGTGKSYFCRRLMEVLECRGKWMSMDQPTAGSQLRGMDRHWSTASHGVLFELLGLGETANAIVVLDEIDKAPRRQGSQDVDALAQLYSSLEPETARRLADVSLDIELDASQVMYFATANGLHNFDKALLSRFEVVPVRWPSVEERRESARRIVEGILTRLGVRLQMRVSPAVAALLGEYAPRVIRRAVERAVGVALSEGRSRIGIEDIEAVLGLGASTPKQEPLQRKH